MEKQESLCGWNRPQGRLVFPWELPNLQHNPWAGWAAGLSPLPAWMCPVLGPSLVAWIPLVLVAQVADWELQRGWNSGWHWWFLLGKRWEMFKFPKPKVAPLFPCPHPAATERWDFPPWVDLIPAQECCGSHTLGAVALPWPGQLQTQSQSCSSPLWVVLAGPGVSLERAGSPLGKHNRETPSAGK